MNANAKAWVEDLRTTTAKQGSNYLRNGDDSFCCLGRACELAVAAGVIPSPKLNPEKFYMYGVDGGFLPHTVRKWLGLSDSSGGYEIDGVQNNLTRDNDTRKLTFSQISDIIECEPEGMFVKEGE